MLKCPTNPAPGREETPGTRFWESPWAAAGGEQEKKNPIMQAEICPQKYLAWVQAYNCGMKSFI